MKNFVVANEKIDEDETTETLLGLSLLCARCWAKTGAKVPALFVCGGESRCEFPLSVRACGFESRPGHQEKRWTIK